MRNGRLKKQFYKDKALRYVTQSKWVKPHGNFVNQHRQIISADFVDGYFVRCAARVGEVQLVRSRCKCNVVRDSVRRVCGAQDGVAAQVDSDQAIGSATGQICGVEHLPIQRHTCSMRSWSGNFINQFQRAALENRDQIAVLRRNVDELIVECQGDMRVFANWRTI